jgi:hypothetical protein
MGSTRLGLWERGPVLVTDHALERYQIHHPTARKADILSILPWGYRESGPVIQAVTGRGSEQTDIFVVAPDCQGAFVLVPDEKFTSIVTYLRFGESQSAFFRRAYAGMPNPGRPHTVVEMPITTATSMPPEEETSNDSKPPSVLGDMVSKVAASNPTVDFSWLPNGDGRDEYSMMARGGVSWLQVARAFGLRDSQAAFSRAERYHRAHSNSVPWPPHLAKKVGAPPTEALKSPVVTAALNNLEEQTDTPTTEPRIWGGKGAAPRRDAVFAALRRIARPQGVTLAALAEAAGTTKSRVSAVLSVPNNKKFFKTKGQRGAIRYWPTDAIPEPEEAEPSDPTPAPIPVKADIKVTTKDEVEQDLLDNVKRWADFTYRPRGNSDKTVAWYSNSVLHTLRFLGVLDLKTVDETPIVTIESLYDESIEKSDYPKVVRRNKRRNLHNYLEWRRSTNGTPQPSPTPRSEPVSVPAPAPAPNPDSIEVLATHLEALMRRLGQKKFTHGLITVDIHEVHLSMGDGAACEHGQPIGTEPKSTRKLSEVTCPDCKASNYFQQIELALSRYMP